MPTMKSLETTASLENLVSCIVDPLLTTDKLGIVTFFSQGAEELSGYKNDEIVGKHVSTCYKNGMKESKRIMRLLLREESAKGYEVTFMSKDGEGVPTLLSASLLKDLDGEVIGTFGIFKDISERKKLENELKERKDFLESVIESCIDGITVLDREGKLIFAGKGTEDMLGYCRQGMQGVHISEYYIGGEEEARKIMGALLKHGKLSNYETVILAADGQAVPISLSASLLVDDKGKVTGSLGVFKDITDRKQLEKELEKLSITDNLTGLYNQRHFYNELKREIERAIRHARPLSLLLLDVDNFKHYNDTYGHLEGDAVLQKVGEVIACNIRKGLDSGYRYGGDEFIIILPEAEEDQSIFVAERIRSAFKDFEMGNTTLSIGHVAYRREYDIKTFIRHADEAMYASKHLGGDRISLYRQI